MQTMFAFRNLLWLVAGALAIYAYDEAGFWYGAVGVFLLWWADNDRTQSATTARERQMIAQFAPALMGKSDVDSMAFVLQAIQQFNDGATLEERRRVTTELTWRSDEWALVGSPMPAWRMLNLLHQLEEVLSLVRDVNNLGDRAEVRA